MSSLLAQVIEAHGGMDRWQALRSIDARVTLSGGLYTQKGFPEGLTDVNVRIDPHQPDVSISPYGRFDRRGFFTPERVWVEDRAGKLTEERSQPQPHFEHVRESTWDQLDRLYFTSYALWNYLTTPFLFGERSFESEEVEPHHENGQTWRRLRVRFPAHIPTHSQAQTLYFNDKGLLQRLDYTAAAPVSHYCYDHVNFNGIVFPTLRRVVRQAANGEGLAGPTAVLIQISDIRLK
ncbi:MAG: hypothetical protein RL701_469 [Pseudomonadota bacterium]|jgi:hypothetical protein